MLVSHKYKFVFVHLGKTAGVSISNALKPYCDVTNGDIIMEGINVDNSLNHHAKAFEIKAAFEKLGWDWNSYYKFMSMRNPFEIIHSDFYYQKYQGISQFGDGPPSNDQPFYGWAKKCYETIHMKFPDYFEMVYGHWDGGFVRSWGTDMHKNILVDHICENRSLQKDFDIVCEKIGIPKIELKRDNTTDSLINKKRPSLKEDYNTELIEKISFIFKEDIDMFNYTFEEAK